MIASTVTTFEGFIAKRSLMFAALKQNLGCHRLKTTAKYKQLRQDSW
jgi:hypothetical protein